MNIPALQKTKQTKKQKNICLLLDIWPISDWFWQSWLTRDHIYGLLSPPVPIMRKYLGGTDRAGHFRYLLPGHHVLNTGGLSRCCVSIAFRAYLQVCTPEQAMPEPGLYITYYSVMTSEVSVQAETVWRYWKAWSLIQEEWINGCCGTTWGRRDKMESFSTHSKMSSVHAVLVQLGPYVLCSICADLYTEIFSVNNFSLNILH